VPEFEAAKVLTFPNLKAHIDYGYWAKLGTREYPALRKLGGQVQDDNNLTVKLHRESLEPTMRSRRRRLFGASARS
jgi:hypothetical protein